jgi:hypothetical protein
MATAISTGFEPRFAHDAPLIKQISVTERKMDWPLAGDTIVDAMWMIVQGRLHVATVRFRSIAAAIEFHAAAQYGRGTEDRAVCRERPAAAQVRAICSSRYHPCR